MSSIDKFQLLKLYFDERHVKVKSEWLQYKLSGENSQCDFEQIYLEWLEQDWNLPIVKQWCIPSLNSELSLSLLNTKKKTFEGQYLLQVNYILDISKPLSMGNHVSEEKEDENSENDDNSEDDENFAYLFKKGKKPGTKQATKKERVQVFGRGPRMLLLGLTDGHNDCVAIEYQPLSWLNEKMIGSKILLSGPFDVYMGCILLRYTNCRIVSDKTFNMKNNDQITNVKQNEDLLEMLSNFEQDSNLSDLDIA